MSPLVSLQLAEGHNASSPDRWNQIWPTIQRAIRTHPGVGLLLAGAAGLIIGSLIRRR
jgi:hypothetical protein